jgi:serine protease Do
MSRKIFLFFVLMSIAGFAFGQTSTLRDYVGMINQGFHPDIIKFLQKLRNELNKRGYNSTARSLDEFIKGDSGTGFVYVGSDGKNYILTNYHVISQALTLSITFETQDGEKTKYSDLQIVGADEDMDIALLAFAGGQNPFKQGLSLLSRPVVEGEDVYSAGFPGAGSAMIWQLGRGIVSNASVRLPPEDENDKALGPYIQHTAQIDPGNSGGPLLIQTRGVPTGYAVAGINTLSIRRRQAANYSIPIARVTSFLNTSLKPPATDQRQVLEERVNAFLMGLKTLNAVYPHIARFLSNTCTGENAEYAIDELFSKASKDVRDKIFDRDIISGLTYSVAWLIEDSLRSNSRTRSISATVDSINPGEDGSYNVNFMVNGANVTSIWINEYGIWRIRSFGTVASGDKTASKKRRPSASDNKDPRDNPTLMISGGLALPLDSEGAALGLDLTLKLGKYMGIGINGYFGQDYTQMEMRGGIYVPIRIKSTALTPFADLGFGTMFFSKEPNSDTPFPFTMGFSFRGGLIFTTALVPGLYLQAAYQGNAYQKMEDWFSGINWLHPMDVIYRGVGYSWR